MKSYLRTLFVTFLLCIAALITAAVVLYRTQHLSFYNPAQAQAKFGISRQDAALIRNGQVTYIWVIPKAGIALNRLQQPTALIGLVYLPALLICLYEINRLAKHQSYRPYAAGQRPNANQNN